MACISTASATPTTTWHLGSQASEQSGKTTVDYVHKTSGKYSLQCKHATLVLDDSQPDGATDSKSHAWHADFRFDDARSANETTTP